MDGDQLVLLDEAPADVVLFCAEQAEAIRVLGRRVAGDILEIGTRLIAVQKAIPGRFELWLQQEFGWHRATAYNYIAVADSFGDRMSSGTTLEIDAKALYLLSGPTVPEAARDEAIEQAEQGERITKAKAAELIADARREERSAARSQIDELESKLQGIEQAIETELANAVDQKIKPLTDEIARLAKDRDGAKSTLDKLRASIAESEKRATTEPQTAPIDGTISFRAMCIRQGVATLKEALAITPDQYLGIEREVAARAHNRSADPEIAATCADATAIRQWLGELIEKAGG